jgi:hypothetical protein
MEDFANFARLLEAISDLLLFRPRKGSIVHEHGRNNSPVVVIKVVITRSGRSSAVLAQKD